nr:hypothetical protein [Chloroflexota bacterium]
RVALDHAIGSARVDDASRLVFALWRFWQVRGYLREGLTWAQRVLALAPGDARLRLRALEAAGGLTYWIGELDLTERYYVDAYERAGALGDEAERAKAAYNLSFAYLLNESKHGRARELLEEALTILRKHDDRGAIGRAAWALGAVYGEGWNRSREDYLRSRQLAQEALEQHRALGNRFDIAWDLHSTGLAALHLGESDTAERDWRESIQMFVEAGDSSGIVLLLSDFTELARVQGDTERQDILVGAWTAMSKRTGVGLASLWGTTEGRVLASDIPPERRPALERGLAMKTDEALAYALAPRHAKTTS